MALLALPRELFAAVVDLVLLTSSPFNGVQLRLVNHRFNEEVMQAILKRGVGGSSISDAADGARCIDGTSLLRFVVCSIQVDDEPTTEPAATLHAAVNLLFRIRTANPGPRRGYPPPQYRPSDKTEWTTSVAAATIAYLGPQGCFTALGPNYAPDTPPGSSMDWAMITAVFLDDEHLVTILLERLSNDDERSRAATNSLYMAISRRNVSMLTLLLDRNANANAPHRPLDPWTAWTPIEAASKSGKCESVKKLLEPRYKVDTANLAYVQAMLYIVGNDRVSGPGYESILRNLLARNTIVNPGTLKCLLLCTASSRGRVSMARIILASGVDLASNPNNDIRCTPLYVAASSGHADIVRLLLENKATDPELVHGRSSLRAAAAYGHLEAFRALFEVRGDIKAAGLNGGRALFCLAAAEGRVEIMEYLLWKGIDISDEEFFQKIASMATKNNRDHAVEALMRFALVLETESLATSAFSTEARMVYWKSKWQMALVRAEGRDRHDHEVYRG